MGLVFRILLSVAMSMYWLNRRGIRRRLDGMGSSSGITIREGDGDDRALDIDSRVAGSGRKC